MERATVEETELPAKQIVRFNRIGVGTQPLRIFLTYKVKNHVIFDIL